MFIRTQRTWMEAVYISVLGHSSNNCLVHAGHQSSELNHFPQEQLVGEEKLHSKTGLWTGLLLEELSALTIVTFRDTSIKFLCSHTQGALLASLVLWLRHMGLTLEEDTSLVKVFRIMEGVTFWLLSLTVSERQEKISLDIFYLTM